MNKYINLTVDNIDEEHICCAIGDPKHQDGVERKKDWIKEKAKNAPCIFNNWANFYKGKFVSNTILNAKALEKLLK